MYMPYNEINKKSFKRNNFQYDYYTYVTVLK